MVITPGSNIFVKWAEVRSSSLLGCASCRPQGYVPLAKQPKPYNYTSDSTVKCFCRIYIQVCYILGYDIHPGINDARARSGVVYTSSETETDFVEGDLLDNNSSHISAFINFMITIFQFVKFLSSTLRLEIQMPVGLPSWLKLVHLHL